LIGSGCGSAGGAGRLVHLAAESLRLLGDPTRIKILWALLQGESSVACLADLVGASPTAVSQHLAKLRLAGLVRAAATPHAHIPEPVPAHRAGPPNRTDPRPSTPPQAPARTRNRHNRATPP